MTDNVIPFPSGGRSGEDATPPPLTEADVLAFMAAFGDGPFARPTPKLLRKRAKRAAFIVRIDLDGAQPPIWRRLRLASDLTLPQLHEIMQVAMGWTDSHLHHFVMGPDARDVYRVQHFPTAFDIEEGDEGIPEAEVRLDQVIAKPGHRLFYEYDFGDGWWHTIKLEKVEPWNEGDPDAFCLAGRNACPPEDVGGLGGYAEVLDMLSGGTDNYDREYVLQVLTWMPPDFHPEAFSVDEVNTALASLLPALELWHPVLTELVIKAGGSPLSDVGALIKRATVERPRLTEAEIADAVRGYQLLLAKIGDGINLTKAGYLPPRIVEELFTELNLEDQWIGRGNREDLTPPVLELRESATALGLVRKARGRLTVTSTGRKVAGDPSALLRHTASRLPLGKPHQKDAGALAWLFTAAGENWYHCDDEAGELMEWLGWRTADGTPMGRAVYLHSEPTWEVIRSLGGRLPERQSAVAHELLRNPFGDSSSAEPN